MDVLREGEIQNQKTYEGLRFPKVFIPGEKGRSLPSLIQHLHENREFIAEQLQKHGALLFRGFPVRKAQDFNEIVEAFEWEEHPYTAGRATRSRVVGKVWTANEGPLDQEIFFHHEMAVNKSFPTKVFFFCETAPPMGGQTAILKSHKVTDHMESVFPEFVKQMQEKGLLTIEVLSGGGSTGDVLLSNWPKVYGTTDPKEAEKKAALDGKRLEWREDGSVHAVRGPVEGIKVFQGYNGSRAWFNYIPFVMFKEMEGSSKLKLGDGSSIPEEVMEESKMFMNNECVDITWENGDIMMLDNLAVQHAKRPSLPPRRLLFAMCK